MSEVKKTRGKKKRKTALRVTPLLSIRKRAGTIYRSSSRAQLDAFARTNIHKTQISSKIARASFAPRRKNDDARFPPLRAQKKISLSERARFPRPPRGEERKNTQRRERRIPRVSHKSRAEIPSERGKDKKNVPLLVVCVMWFYIYITLNNGEIFFS